jgi:hypothetical protein
MSHLATTDDLFFNKAGLDRPRLEARRAWPTTTAA